MVFAAHTSNSTMCIKTNNKIPEYEMDYKRDVILAHKSNSQNCIKPTNNKIPEYAKDYKKEYLYIRGIQSELKYILDIVISYKDFYVKKYLERRLKIIKRFMFEQERGNLKDISSFKIKKYDFIDLYDLRQEILEVFEMGLDLDNDIICIEFLFNFLKFYDKLKFDIPDSTVFSDYYGEGYYI